MSVKGFIGLDCGTNSGSFCIFHLLCLALPMSFSGSPDLHTNLPYFIDYNVHMSIVRTGISQWFLAKNLFLFFKNNFTRINHCKLIHHKSHLQPFLSYLPCSAQGIFQHHFQCKKVLIILDKIWYYSLLMITSVKYFIVYAPPM